MGATKLLGERLITAANLHSGDHNTRFASVRFGNVLNTSGSVLNIFRDQFRRGEALTVTSENMTRFFLSMSQALDLCVYASENMIGGEIFVRNMGSCSIMSLARAISSSGEFSYEIIGLKPGEKAFEELVTQSEAVRTVSSKGWYIILPDTLDSNESIATAYKNAYGSLSQINKPVTSEFELLSDSEVFTNVGSERVVVIFSISKIRCW